MYVGYHWTNLLVLDYNCFYFFLLSARVRSNEPIVCMHCAVLYCNTVIGCGEVASGGGGSKAKVSLVTLEIN